MGEGSGHRGRGQGGAFGRRGLLLRLAGAAGLAAGAAGCAVRPFGQLDHGPVAAVPRAGLVHFAAGIPGLAQFSGFGFALDAETVVTNGHVARGMGAGEPGAEMTGTLHNGRRLRCVTLAALESPDLAVLRALEPMAALSPAPRRARPGERVWLIGAPLMNRPVVEGVVAAPLVRGRRGEMFSIRAPATFGFSGGPAVNARGEVLGMVTALHGLNPQAMLSVAVLGFDLPALLDADGREMLAQHQDTVAATARRLQAAAGPGRAPSAWMGAPRPLG